MKHLLALSLLLGASVTASASTNPNCPNQAKGDFTSPPKQEATKQAAAQMFPAKGQTNAAQAPQTIN